MRVWPLILFAGALPTIAVLLCFWLSLSEQLIPACNPLIDGCTTISRACRYGTAYYVFKALVLPAASLLALYWWWTAQRLAGTGRHRGVVRSLRILGVTASLFLALYASFLGSDGELFALYRRMGATLFFSATFFCQLLLAVALRHETGWAGLSLYRSLCGLVGAQFTLGLLSLPITAWVVDKDRAENIIEWWFAIAMMAFFLLSTAMWRSWRLEFTKA